MKKEIKNWYLSTLGGDNKPVVVLQSPEPFTVLQWILGKRSNFTITQTELLKIAQLLTNPTKERK